jgi:four helix bundle protein
MKDFRRLMVWEKAHAMTLATYRLTANFPREELYGISSQMRRCSASVAANIAEGCGRIGNGEFRQFLNTAAGSAVELEYFLLLAHDLGLVPIEDYESLRTGGSRSGTNACIAFAQGRKRPQPFGEKLIANC